MIYLGPLALRDKAQFSQAETILERCRFESVLQRSCIGLISAYRPNEFMFTDVGNHFRA